MLRLGERQFLEYVKKMDFGIYLADPSDKEATILLPKKEVEDYYTVGDEIEVFIYRDSSDRLIATRKHPKVELGGIAKLKVVAVTKIGAFLDWGLEKDLLIPFKEQRGRLKEGEDCLIALYIDKSDRLCGTMNLYEYLNNDHEIKQGDEVTGTVYEVHGEYGVFVAVDNQYHGLIQKKDVHETYKIGSEVKARVVAVREDGKLVLNTRQEAHLEIDNDAKAIMELLEDHGGFIPYNDKTEPEIIKEEFSMSKRAFKRAVGNLLKQGKIQFKGDGIEKSD